MKYSSWHEARQASSGYDQPIILQVASAEAVALRNNAVPRRRQLRSLSRPMPIALKRIASQSTKKLHVVDFGGSLGEVYFRLRNLGYLNAVSDVRWSVVEQPHIVDHGREFFQDDVLRFFPTLSESLMGQQSDVALLSGVLQYIEDPYGTLLAIADTSIATVILDRTATTDHPTDILSVEHVAHSIYQTGVSYPVRFFSRATLRNILSQHWEIVEEYLSWDSGVQTPTRSRTNTGRGYILRKRV